MRQMNKKEIKKLIKESIKEVIEEDYVITEKTSDMKELEEYWNQMDNDKEKNRKLAKEYGVKVYTAKEIANSDFCDDENFIPLEFIGKPSPMFAKFYIVENLSYDTREYIRVADLKYN